jgi:hypothetical protein
MNFVTDWRCEIFERLSELKEKARQHQLQLECEEWDPQRLGSQDAIER